MTPSATSLAVFDAPCSAARERRRLPRCCRIRTPRPGTPTLVLLTEDAAAAGKSFRNIARVDVMPVGDAGVADVIGAASLLVSQAALAELDGACHRLHRR